MSTTTDELDVAPDRSTPPEESVDGGLTRFVDGAQDLAVLAFALWTVVYHVGRKVGASTDALVIATALLTALAAALVWRAHLRPVRQATDRAAVPRGSRLCLVLPIAIAVLSAVSAVRVGATMWYATWALAVLAVVPQVWLVVRSGSEGPSSSEAAAPGGRVRPVETLLALGASLAMAALSLIFFRVDPDDAFYVNKSVWVADHGTIPSRDTIYTEQALPALRGAGTAPVQSIEVLQGALGHLFGVSGGSMAYLVTPPIASFLAVWALWRLLRAWAPRRRVAAWAASRTFLLFGGLTGAVFGVFFVGRIWQGKVMFVCIAIPLTYLFLTRWLRGRRAYDAVLLFAIGIVGVGLTSTATFLVPIIGLSVAVAMLLSRRRGWYAALLPTLYPLGSGVAVALTAQSDAFAGVPKTSDVAFHFVFATGAWALVSWGATLLLGRLVVDGPARIVATGGVVGAVIVLAPGMPELMTSVIGAAPVLWRLTWVAPVTVAVGLLATIKMPKVPALVSNVAIPVTVVVVLVSVGLPIWSPERSAYIARHPTWKYFAAELKQARLLEHRDPGPGPVLAPNRTMRAMALVTTSVQAVDPREFYLPSLDEPPSQHRSRVLLSKLMDSPTPSYTDREVESALEELRVSMVCLRPGQKHVTRQITSLGWVPTERVTTLNCWLPPTG